MEWVQDSVVEMKRESVILEKGEAIPYELFVIATGSGAGHTLPSRVGTTTRLEGTVRLSGMQQKIKRAKRLLAVEGGEVVTDAKSLYPEKTVTLVHSWDAVMHRFGPELQAEALNGLRKLGVEVVLGDRLTSEDEEIGIAMLKSGKTVE